MTPDEKAIHEFWMNSDSDIHKSEIALIYSAGKAAGVAEERERCAAIADTMLIEGACPDTEESAQDHCASYIAEAIRAG